MARHGEAVTTQCKCTGGEAINTRHLCQLKSATVGTGSGGDIEISIKEAKIKLTHYPAAARQ